jgi:hypothetical protein
VIDGFPSFARECFEGGTEERMVDGFFFKESTEVLECFTFTDEDFGSPIVNVFYCFHEDGSKEIFGGEGGFSFLSGIGFAERLKIVMSGLEEFGIFFRRASMS